MLFLTDSIFRDHYFYFVEPFCPGAWAVLSRAAAFRRIGRQLKLKFPYIGNFDSLHSQEPEINLFSPWHGPCPFTCYGNKSSNKKKGDVNENCSTCLNRGTAMGAADFCRYAVRLALVAFSSLSGLGLV